MSLGPRVSVTLTTENLSRALTPRAGLRFSSARAPAEPTIYVSDSKRYQEVEGFGAAMTDSSAWLLAQLDPVTHQRIMAAIARAVEYERIPIGASDFTHDGVPYSYDDMAGGQTDPMLSHFSIAHDLAYIIPELRQQLALNPSTEFFASAWSAPAWMKANDALNNPTWDSGDLLPSYYSSYAAYLVRFLQAYAGRGVPVAAITPGNELGWTTMYPGMGMTDEPGFVQYVMVPAIRAAGLSTKVYDGDSGCCDYQLRWLQRPGYAQAISGTAVHCYAGVKPMSDLHTANPSGDIILSECSPGIVNYSTAETVIASMRNWANAVDLWNIALDSNGGPKQQAPGCTGCSGLVTIDGDKATLNSNYYQLAQASLFIDRGAQRIDSSRLVTDYYSDTTVDYGVTPGVDNVAFENPDRTKVLMAYNNSSTPVRFQIAWQRRYITYSLPAGSTVTFTWR